MSSSSLRWVFIRPRNQSPYYDPELQEPLGIQYLAACRRRFGDAVLLLDCSLEGSGEVKLARRAAAFRPDAVGFSLTTAQELTSLNRIYEECRRVCENVRIHWLAGGNFVSTEPEQALHMLPEDFNLVRFEGEEALEILAEKWRLSGNVPATDRFLNSRVINAPPVTSLDALPFPERPYADVILSNEWAFNLQASRGCFGACRFCASPGMRGRGSPAWRGRSSENIVDEIELLCNKYGARSFNFVDEDFLGPNPLAEQRALTFTQEIQKRKLHIAFSIQVRPASLNKEIIGLLAKAGLVYVFMGLESDDPEDFKRWNRPWTPDVWRYARCFREHGVELNAGVMLFHSHATLSGIRHFARKLQNYGLLEYRSAINELDAMPGSVFYQNAMDEGLIFGAHPGPQPLPYLNPEVRHFKNDLVDALAPLGPPSMHALCALPPLAARRRFCNGPVPAYDELKRILRVLDKAVARTVFLLLDQYEEYLQEKGLVAALRVQNLTQALQSSQHLAEAGFAPSFEALREAIRMDAGI